MRSAASVARRACILAARVHRTQLIRSAAAMQLCPCSAAVHTRPATTISTAAAAASSSSFSLPSAAAPAASATDSSSSAATHAGYASLLHTLLTINSERKVRLGIETTRRLLAALGSDFDPNSIPVIHVAGSNGKGSTTLKIARALQLHGLRVGVYTSPHVSSFRERIAVNGEMISEEACIELLPPMLSVAQREDIPATFFELGTALAFGFFRQQRVDVAVLEVGLGGRLDSTNVIARPELAVICSIALEHTQWLGDTVELIAREKAGILKAGAPALLGSSVPLQTVQTVAAEVGAGPVEQLSESFPDYDAENSALAARAVHIVAESSPRIRALLESSSHRGLNPALVAQGVRVRPPCRFQQVRWDASSGKGIYVDEDGSLGGESAASARVPGTIDVVLDVCHNPAAFERLFEKLRKEYSPPSAASSAASSTVAAPALSVRAVVGFSSDKDFLSCLRQLMAHCDSVHIVQGDTPRAARAEDVMSQALKAGLPAEYPRCQLSIISPSPHDTLLRVLDAAASEASTLAAPRRPLVLCCGTFFIMSDVRRALRLPHPIDPVAVNEQSLTPMTPAPSAAASATANPSR